MLFIASNAGANSPTTPVAIPKNDQAAAYLMRRQREVIQLVERSHSPLEHDFFFAYIDFLFDDYFAKHEYSDREAFRHQLAIDVGHVKIRRLRMAISYLERMIEMARSTGWVDLEIPKSMSFAKSHHEEFHALVKRVSDWGFEQVGIDIDEFKKKKPRNREA